MSVQQGLVRETEFFKYHPLAFVEDLTDACKDLCADVADSLEAKIKLDKRTTPKSDDQVYAEVEKMMEVMLGAFTKNFGTLQTYVLQQFFTVPPEISLQRSPANTSLHVPTEEEEERLDSELEGLHQKKVDTDTQLQSLRESKNALQQKVEMMVALRDKLQQVQLENNVAELEKEMPGICKLLSTLSNQVTAVSTHKV